MQRISARAQRKADRFDLGEVFLEIALVISSLALLSRNFGSFAAIRAGLEAADAIRGGAESRHHNDREHRGDRIGAQPDAELEAVHPGHHHVEQEHVGLRGGDRRNGFGAIAGGDDLAAGVAEHFEHQLAVELFVVDDQDASSLGHPHIVAIRSGMASAFGSRIGVRSTRPTRASSGGAANQDRDLSPKRCAGYP